MVFCVTSSQSNILYNIYQDYYIDQYKVPKLNHAHFIGNECVEETISYTYNEVIRNIDLSINVETHSIGINYYNNVCFLHELVHILYCKLKDFHNQLLLKSNIDIYKKIQSPIQVNPNYSFEKALKKRLYLISILRSLSLILNSEFLVMLLEDLETDNI